MAKLKINDVSAKIILNQLVDEHVNVSFWKENNIYIVGRQIIGWLPKPIIKRKPKPKKPPKWKDVTRP